MGYLDGNVRISKNIPIDADAYQLVLFTNEDL